MRFPTEKHHYVREAPLNSFETLLLVTPNRLGMTRWVQRKIVIHSMIQLAYFSSTSSTGSSRDTESILRVSRRNNAWREITGLLLYDKCQYLQVIEGAADAIIELYAVISRDVRHIGVTEVFRHPIVERDFTGSSMAYQEVSSIRPDLEGYAEFLLRHFDMGSMDAAATRSFLRLFRPNYPKAPRS